MFIYLAEKYVVLFKVRFYKDFWLNSFNKFQLNKDMKTSFVKVGQNCA